MTEPALEAPTPEAPTNPTSDPAVEGQTIEDIEAAEKASAAAAAEQQQGEETLGLQDPDFDPRTEEKDLLKDFSEQIPEHLRESKVFENVKGWDDLVKEVENARSLVGKKVADMYPNVNSTEEEVAAFRELAGIPETAEGYDLEGAEEVSEEEYMQFQDIAHKMDLTPDQAQGMFDAMLDVQDAEMDEFEEAYQEEVATATRALKQEWGEDLEANMAIAQRFLENDMPSITSSPLFEELKNDPSFIRDMHALGARYGEKAPIEGAYGTVSMSKQQAEIQFNQAPQELKDAFFDKHHKRHDEAKKELSALYAARYQ